MLCMLATALATRHATALLQTEVQVRMDARCGREAGWLNSCRVVFASSWIAMRFGLCCALLLACAAVPFVQADADATANLPIHLCPGSAGSVYSVDAVTLKEGNSATPGHPFTLELRGQLDANLTGGVYSLQLYRTTDLTHPSSVGTLLATEFGSLTDLVVGGWPQKGTPVWLQLQWTLPTGLPLTADDTQLIWRLEAVNQAEAKLTCVLVTLPVTTDVAPPAKPADKKALGYICAFISVFFFGTNFLPVKAFDTGDGVFFQWVLCIGVWLVGVAVQLIRQAAFEPLAMVGGMMWCIGNMATVPIIQMIGLGVGMCICTLTQQQHAARRRVHTRVADTAVPLCIVCVFVCQGVVRR